MLALVQTTSSRAEIDRAIGELTGANPQSEIRDPKSVWVYGQMVWAQLPAFRFVCCRGLETRQVGLMANAVKRYRDGESQFFLIEMPARMADALDITDLALDHDELARMKRNIDTTRAW